MCPPTKLQVFASFLPQKMFQPFITPHNLEIYLRQTIFFPPKLKMKLKGLHFVDVADIQEAVTDELKKLQNGNFRQLFRNCTTMQKPVYMPMELILNLKKGMCLRF
jgi:hypothetical protein